MGRYSNAGLAHGTQGAPQVTMEENLYKLKIEKIADELKSDFIKQQKSSVTNVHGKRETRNEDNKNILTRIIALILSMGYRKISINETTMYIKNDIVINITFIEEYGYYILEKADTLLNAQNDEFELLASISDEIRAGSILKTIKDLLVRFE